MGQEEPQRAGCCNASASYDTVFTNAKAGMEGVDAEKVKRVVYHASKGSSHFKNEQRKEKAHQERIAQLQARASALSPADLAHHTATADVRLAALEARRDLTRTWLHVDMDAFYAAVEERDNPALRGRPFAVGGIGMISTASYAARKFGVRSAMPGFIALKLCPHLQFVPVNFSKYRAASEQTRAVFRDYDPGVQAGSLDEAYLDVTDHCTATGRGGAAVAAEIRGRVHQQTGLTCSVGIAAHRMLAKICSDRNKPNGQFELEASRDAIMAFMRDLSIRKVPGVGKVGQKTLGAFGIATCGDLLDQRGLVEALFSETAVDSLAHVALGLGSTRHDPAPEEGEVARKGISHERTFRSTGDQRELEGRLRELAGALAADMAEEGLAGRTVTLKLKHATFELKTRATTLPRAVSSADDLYAVGHRMLLDALPCELRLVGLRVSGFLEAPKRERGQLSLAELLARRQQPDRKPYAAGTTLTPALGCVAGGDHGELHGVVTSWEHGAGSGGSSPAGSGAAMLPPCDAAALELTLRDWQDAAGDDEQPLVLSLADWQVPGPASQAAPPARLQDVMPQPSLPALPADMPAPDRQGCAGGPGLGGAPRLHSPDASRDFDPRRGCGALEERTLREGGSADRRRLPVQQQQQQQPAAMWACRQCTFENPGAVFWCEMCGTSKLGPRQEVAAAIEPSKAATAGDTTSRGTTSHGSSGGSKAKRPRKASTGGAAPSILRFVSAAQRQTSPLLSAAHPGPQQVQQPLSQQQQQPAEPLPEGALPKPVLHAVEAPQTHQQPEAQSQHANASDSEWSEGGPPDSPLLPGEDVMECPLCGEWVRETRLQAHEAVHSDEQLARKLQREEDQFGRLWANPNAVKASNASAGAKKRAATGKPAGGTSKQATLLSAFGKRPTD